MGRGRRKKKKRERKKGRERKRKSHGAGRHDDASLTDVSQLQRAWVLGITGVRVCTIAPKRDRDGTRRGRFSEIQGIITVISVKFFETP